MNKVFGIFALWLIVVFVYIILAVSMPAIRNMSNDAIATANASSNMTNYPGTIEALQFWPVIAWFIPGAVGFAVTVFTLRSR